MRGGLLALFLLLFLALFLALFLLLISGPLMPLQAAIRYVDVLSSHAVGTTYTFNDLGFDANFLILSIDARSETTDSTGGGIMRRGFGVATSTTSRWAVAATSTDAATTANAGSRRQTDACALHCGAGATNGALQGALDLDAFVAGGFRLIVDTQFTANIRVKVVAIGGITDASSEVAIEPATATTQTIAHGLGGTPDVVFFASNGVTSATGTGTADSNTSVGWATASHNYVCAGGSNNGPTTMQTIRYGRAGECLVHFDAGLTVTDGRAAVTGLDATNITLTWSEVNGANNRRFQWCAVRGGSWHSGDVLTQTDTTTAITESGLSFLPVIGLVMSHNTAASTADTVQDHDSRSFGAFTSPSSRFATACWDENAIGTSETATGVEFDACYLRIAADDTIAGLMDVTSVASGQVDWIMDDADPDQAFVGVLLAGDPAAGETFDETLSLAAASTIAPAASADFGVSLALGTSAGLMDASVGNLVGTVPLTSDVILTPAASADFLATLGLTSSADLTPTALADLLGSLPLSASASITPLAAADFIAVLSLIGDASQSAIASGSWQAALTLSADADYLVIGGSDFTSALELAVAAAVAQSAVNEMMATLDLPAASALTPAATASFLAALSLPSSAALQASSVASLLAALSLTADAAQSEVGGSEFQNSLALTVVSALVQSAIHEMAATLNLPVDATLTPAGTAALLAELALPSSAALQTSSVASLLASLALTANATQAQTGGSDVHDTVALSVSAALTHLFTHELAALLGLSTAVAVMPSSTGTFNVSLNLPAEAIQSQVGSVNLSTLVAFAAEAAQSQAAGLMFEGLLGLSASAAMSPSAVLVLSPAVTLAVQAALVSSSVASLLGTLELSVDVVLSPSSTLEGQIIALVIRARNENFRVTGAANEGFQAARAANETFLAGS